MTTIYVTGDRSFEPLMAVQVVAAVLNTVIQKTGGQLKIVTGNSPTGIERAVRYLVPDPLVTVVDYSMNEGKPDFLASMPTIKAEADGGAYVIHLDPLNSRLAQAVSMSFAPELVNFPLDVLSNKVPEDLSMFDENLQVPVAEEEVPPEVEK